MNQDKNLPLTETTYYILLVLLKPAHGYLIMQKIEELSDGQVRLAAGTLYGALENLIKLKWIELLKGEDNRRKVYAITPLGKNILHLDYQRIKRLIDISDAQFIDEGGSI